MKASFPIVLLLLGGALVTSNAVAQDLPTAPVDTLETTETDSVGVEATQDVDMMGTAGHAGDVTSVEFILNEAPDDHPVTLRGTLTESLGDERYTFEDETGTIRVRIDDDVFSPDQFSEGLEVELVGEVDKDTGEVTEVEVEMVHVG